MQNIIADFKNGRGLLFLGAGISLDCDDKKGFPNALELTQLLSRRFLNREPTLNESLMQIAQQIIWENNGSRQPLESFLIEIFDNPLINPLSTHISLTKLNVPMITTNFDRLIEEAFRLENLRLSVILEDRDLVKCENNILIKTHGCVSKVNNCIISEEDYFRWMSRESDIKNLIRSWFIMYRVIFVGYSLCDMNFRKLIIELKRKFGSSFRNCYIVTPYIKEDSYDYNFLYNVIGAQFIKVDAKVFLEQLASAVSKKYRKYTETDLQEDYFKLNINLNKSFQRYAAEMIFEKIFCNNAGNLELDKYIVNEIYSITSSREDELYVKHNEIINPDGMIYVPPGEFIMGGSRLGNERIRIEKIDYGYFIDECQVTNKQYRQFTKWFKETNCHQFCHKDEPDNKNHLPFFDFTGKSAKDVKIVELPNDYFTNSKYDNYPVVNIDWWDAYAFSRWAGKRLPTEIEWEKTARGIDGRVYPYGNTFDPAISNVAESGINHATPVKKYKKGRSPYGCYDMSGNVWDWCADTFEFGASTKEATRVYRGGSCTRGIIKACCTFRNGRHPSDRWITRGFRCAKDA